MQPGGWVRIHALQKHACWPNVLRTYAPSDALGQAVGTANGASRAGGDCPGGAWPAGRIRPPTDATPPAALLPGLARSIGDHVVRYRYRWRRAVRRRMNRSVRLRKSLVLKLA